VLTKEAMIPMSDAVSMLTQNTARVMGLNKKGVLAAGMDADIVVFDDDINVRAVFVGGERVI
jgi:N-acetylglucosamine-6-phosphate deacetylase